MPATADSAGGHGARAAERAELDRDAPHGRATHDTARPAAASLGALAGRTPRFVCRAGRGTSGVSAIKVDLDRVPVTGPTP